MISDYVSLRKAGTSYKGLCPFHGEKTPSFNVNRDRGFFHCFGCGVSGDHFRFLTELDGLSFPEAVERVAEIAGVPMPARDPEAEKRGASAAVPPTSMVPINVMDRTLRWNIGSGLQLSSSR